MINLTFELFYTTFTHICVGSSICDIVRTFDGNAPVPGKTSLSDVVNQVRQGPFDVRKTLSFAGQYFKSKYQAIKEDVKKNYHLVLPMFLSVAPDADHFFPQIGPWLTHRSILTHGWPIIPISFAFGAGLYALHYKYSSENRTAKGYLFEMLKGGLYATAQVTIGHLLIDSLTYSSPLFNFYADFGLSNSYFRRIGSFLSYVVSGGAGYATVAAGISISPFLVHIGIAAGSMAIAYGVSRIVKHYRDRKSNALYSTINSGYLSK